MANLVTLFAIHTQQKRPLPVYFWVSPSVQKVYGLTLANYTDVNITNCQYSLKQLLLHIFLKLYIHTSGAGCIKILGGPITRPPLIFSLSIFNSLLLLNFSKDFFSKNFDSKIFYQVQQIAQQAKFSLSLSFMKIQSKF